MAFSWRCPFCGRHATIGDRDHSIDSHTFNLDNKYGPQAFQSLVVVCPNSDCREYALIVTLMDQRLIAGKGWTNDPPKRRWRLIPDAELELFPDYVPASVLADYREAALIRELSPKASATLSRRCLQGMIRDFWRIKAGRLVDEIELLEHQIDPLTWNAIDAVRKIGNIGAHMEKDINEIVEVDPQEAGLLIGLIETLIRDWYVGRHERQTRMASIVATANSKKQPKGAEEKPAPVRP